MIKDFSGSLIRMNEAEFQRLWKYIKSNYGINLSKKQIFIEGRMSHELRRRKIASFTEYMELLENDRTGEEALALLNRITTNLSYFQRENEHFEYLSQTLLPIFEKTHAKTKTLRIWSAGCSTGQEAYNIAMALDSYFGPHKSMWDTTILASDISGNVLKKAESGIYTPEEVEKIPPRLKQKYFVPSGKNFAVVPRIKKEVIFKHFNLMDPFPFKIPFDIIFCRNTMIYFDNETKSALAEKFYRSTAPGGFLFIGHSESLSSHNTKNAKDFYTYVRAAIYQRRPEK